MNKFDILITGDCNLDLIFNDFDKIPKFGEEVIAESFNIKLGSSAGITAVHLAALGAKVAYIGAIGHDDFGEQFKALLQSNGVNTDYMVEKNGYQTGCTVVMSQNDDRANLTYAGAMAQLHPRDIPLQLVATTRFFHLSNPYILPNFRNQLTDFFKAIKAHKAVTSLDPQWDVMEKWDTNLLELLPYIDYFFPNEKELELLLQTNKLPAETLTQMCPTHIINTCGSKGVCHYHSNTSTIYNSYLNKSPIDCIGAGDAFTAGFLAGKIEGQATPEAIRLGCKNGALSTTVAGGGVIYSDREEFEKLFDRRFP
ncbi:carbohydrate kinase family protein [Carboxylicivirga taeanensis]|uniref:carbohydrate kinase family protein n=1 Tax=Carboxylicivirga taeanensis TaxID=1416875 RepID=UPI003F6DC297